jgi:hypothetical protein
MRPKSNAADDEKILNSSIWGVNAVSCRQWEAVRIGAYVWKRTEKRLSGSHRRGTGMLSAERRGLFALHFEGAPPL